MSSRPNVALEKYKYRVDDIILTADGFEEPITIRNDFVKSISFYNDYDNAISPKIQLIFQIDKNEYKKIILNMNTLTASFTIYKIFVGVVRENIRPDDESVEQEHVWKKINLKATNDDNMSTSNVNRLMDDDEFESDSIDTTQQTAVMTLLLYDADNIKKYRSSNYYILSGGKNDLIYNFFKDREFKNILMSPTDNINGNYVIPYGHLGSNLESLNKYYGIYDTPYLFFMDIDVIYLLEKGGIGKALRTGELQTVSIYLEKETNQAYIESGCYEDTDNGMYILNTYAFDVEDNDSNIDYAIGGNIHTVIDDTGEIRNDKIGDYSIDRTIIVNNSKHHSQLIHSIKEQKRRISLNFNNIDLSIITPNKKFTILPDETFYDNKYQLKGDYRLCRSLFLLTKTDDSDLNSSVEITLNKIPH